MCAHSPQAAADATRPAPLLPAQSLPDEVLRVAVCVDVLDNCFITTSWQAPCSAREMPGAVELAALLSHVTGPPIAADAMVEEAAACAVTDSPYLIFCSLRRDIDEAVMPRHFTYYVVRNGGCLSPISRHVMLTPCSQRRAAGARQRQAHDVCGLWQWRAGAGAPAVARRARAGASRQR
jgi:hypothetical protein